MEYKDIPKKDLKAYQALEQRVTDIFNGATGNGDTAEWWIENYWVNVQEVGNVMNAIELTFRDQFNENIYDGFRLTPGHAEYFEQPRKAALWLWETGVRA